MFGVEDEYLEEIDQLKQRLAEVEAVIDICEEWGGAEKPQKAIIEYRTKYPKENE